MEAKKSMPAIEKQLLTPLKLRMLKRITRIGIDWIARSENG
jgi:hypothetical protein